MARARNIKPGFYKNEDLAECSIWARYIFPGLWMLADREGRLEDRPKRIKGELLPFDGQDMNALLNELATRKDAQGIPFIIRYRNSDGSFIQISKFSTHQSPHYSEKQSAIKAPILPECGADDALLITGILPEDSEKPPPIKRGSQPPDSLNPDLLIPDSLNPDSPTADCHTPPQEGRGEARATRLPAHWRPGNALTAQTIASHPDWDSDHFERVLADFRDHWTSKGEKREDWDAAWRKWARAENPGKAPAASGKALADRNMAATEGWAPPA